MDKALRLGKVSAAGGFQLFIGKATSTMIMAVGTIVLARLMLQSEYGLYSIAFIPSLMISLFQDWGVGSAMTKHIAHMRGHEDEDLNDIIIAGVTFEIATGLALSFLSLISANIIASTIFHRPESAPLISIASITIFSGALLTVSQSSFVGFERMGLSSLIMICQSMVKTLAAPLLVFLGYGALGAVLGSTFSSITAGILGLALLYFVLFKNLRKTNPRTRKSSMQQTLRMMIQYGVPLSISSILMGFRIQFFSFMMAFFCDNVMIGNYKIAIDFAVILTFFTIPISTVLFPAFAKLDLKNEHQLLKDVFASSVKYAALFLVPATMAVMVLSKAMIGTLFGENWVHAPFFLALYVISHLFGVFKISIGTFLAGIGETKMRMKLSLLALSLGLPLAFLLIPTLGILGVILGSIFAELPSIFWGLHWTWKHYEAKVDTKSSTRIFIASAIAAITTYLYLNILNIADWIELATGGMIFLLAYIVAAPIIRALNQSDVKNLRAMFSDLGIISKLIDIPLTLAEKITGVYRAPES